MKDNLLAINKKHPLSIIILIALAIRIIAAIFSKGYGFDSEYFFYVETPNAWLDNIENVGYDAPRGISLFYLSINYIIFGFFKLIGMHSPQWLMFVSRLIHALFSLTVITLSYRIAKTVSSKRLATNIAWIMALLWFMPYISVHNIAQAFSLPFLLYGTLLVAKQEKLRNEMKKNNLHRTSFIIAGIFFALGFSIWYYSFLFYVFIIIALIARKNAKGATMSFIGFVPTICVTLTVPDLLVWGVPFAELIAFLKSDFNFVFPIRYYVVAAVTLLIIIGFLRCNKNSKISAFGLRHKRLLRYICAFCCLVNAVLLFSTSLLYSNKPEVKAMTYLSKENKIKTFIIEDKFSDNPKKPPIFYERHWSDYVIVNQENTNVISTLNKDVDYIVFRDNIDMERRVEEMKVYFPNIKYAIAFKPNFAYIMYKWINKIEKDGSVTIYKVSNE